MNIEKFHKQEIAAKQLETALRLFFAGGDLFSVITLAGAAEEILGQLLKQREGKPSRFRSVLELLRPASKAGGESGDQWQETDLFVHMDIRREASFLLGRVIDDFAALTGEATENMRRFNEDVRGRK